MSGSIATSPSALLSLEPIRLADSRGVQPFPPVAILSPLCGMVHGRLENLQSVGGDLIAAFSCYCSQCGGREIQNVALPGHLAPELRESIGNKIGIMRRAEKYIVRRVSA